MALTDQDKKTLQMGLFLAALVAGGAFLARSQIFSMQRERMETEIAQFDADIDEQKMLRNDLLALADRQEEIESMALRILEASERLPNTRQSLEFFEVLEDRISETDFDWNRANPLPARPFELYTEFPYTIHARTAYHEFGQFLNLIEENPDRFMRISHFNIHTDREVPINHIADFEITTFMLHDTPAPVR